MIQKRPNGLPGASRKRWLVGFILLLCLLGLVAFAVFIWNHSDIYFSVTPYPPYPPGAINVQHLESGSLGGYRILQFETDQPAENIQQFYRAALPKRGWQLLCSPTQLDEPGCPLGRSSVVELADAYTRYDDPTRVRLINVIIYKPGENLVNRQNRLVEVIEYRYFPPSP